MTKRRPAAKSPVAEPSVAEPSAAEPSAAEPSVAEHPVAEHLDGGHLGAEYLDGQPSGVGAQPLGARSGPLPGGVARAPGEIRTEAGHYLRAAARDEAPTRYGSPLARVDDTARRVWEIAFGLAVQRRFEPEAPLAEISRTVAIAVHDHAAAALPPIEAEMLVRSALGEQVPLAEIDESVQVGVHLLLFASLADELALGDAELDALIAEAEASSVT